MVNGEWWMVNRFLINDRLEPSPSIPFGALRFKGNTPYNILTNQIGMLYQLSIIN